jgi:hypothetical protein
MGQAAAPSWLVIPLAVATALGALLAVIGVVAAKRSAGPLPAMSDPAVRRRYSVIVGLEFGLLGAGAAMLGVSGHYQWIPVWICFGVGVHSSRSPQHCKTRRCARSGCCLSPSAAVALVVGLASAVAPSTVTGLGAGLCLLAFGLATLLIGGPRQANPSTRA